MLVESVLYKINYMPKKINIDGIRFGKLTVVCQEGRNSEGKYLYKCICDCNKNKYVYVAKFKLTSGHTSSCGCKQNR